MGLINAVKNYDASLEDLRECVNRLEQTICASTTDSRLMCELSGETYMLRKRVDWLEESRDELYDAVDKALEGR